MSSSESENSPRPSHPEQKTDPLGAENPRSLPEAELTPSQSPDRRSDSDNPILRRRQFVSGHDLWRWWQDWGRETLAPPTAIANSIDPSGTRPGLLSHISKSAMACQWDVYLNHGQYPTGMERALAAIETVEEWEDRLSFFREHSEVTRLNRLAGRGPVEVSTELWAIVQLSLGLWEMTDGAFDITSSSLSECWGFLKREGRMPNEGEIALSLESVGMDKLECDPQTQTVRFLHPETQINLGGIGKGWTLDQVAQQLLENQIGDFVFHGGQSSVLAFGQKLNFGRTDSRAKAGSRLDDTAQSFPNATGKKGSNADPTAAIETNSHDERPVGWDVGVSHPLYPDRQLGIIQLCDQALGTSGSGRQFIHYRGQRLSHILDPRTGRPAQGVLSATVLAPTAAQADALGTACFVLGVAGCEKLVQQWPELAILLVVPDARGGRVITMGTMEKFWHPHAVR